MRSEAIPVIRLEIDHMKHAIASAIGIKGSELEEVLNHEIEKQLKILIKTEIPNIVRETIIATTEASCRSYFNCGDGRKAIDDAIAKNFKIDE